MNKLKNGSVYLFSVLLVLIDQIVKFCIINNLDKMPIQIIENVLRFRYCENRGVAFSIGDGNITFFIILNIILIGGLIFYYVKNKSEFNKFATIFIFSVIAGGFSNLIDRIFRGFVVDFIDVSELFDFPVFNVADMCIVVGIFGLICFYIFQIVHENKKISGKKLV